MAPLNFAALKEAVAALKKDPQLLHSQDLSFFADYVVSLGAKLPPKAAPQKPTEAAAPENDDLNDDGVVRFLRHAF